MRRADSRGFVAIVSALIISAVLLSVVIGSAAGSFYARQDTFDRSQAVSARMLAASCVQAALLALATSSDPLAFSIVDRPVAIDEAGTQTCIIDSLSPESGTVSIHAHAAVSNTYSSIAIVVTMPPSLKILSWTEK